MAPTDYERLSAELKELKKSLETKFECLENKLLDPDKGLYARVERNTRFRKNATKLLWLLVGAVVTTAFFLIRVMVLGR